MSTTNESGNGRKHSRSFQRDTKKKSSYQSNIPLFFSLLDFAPPTQLRKTNSLTELSMPQTPYNFKSQHRYSDTAALANMPRETSYTHLWREHKKHQNFPGTATREQLFSTLFPTKACAWNLPFLLGGVILFHFRRDLHFPAGANRLGLEIKDKKWQRCLSEPIGEKT